MGKMPWTVLLWPGLPSVWRCGAWSGLVVAVAFAGLVNLGLLTSLVWRETELFTPGVRNFVWLAVALVWLGSAVWTVDRTRRYPDPDRPTADADTFALAQQYYLQQNWYEAERTVRQLLRRRPRDVEARLLAAAVLRQTGRLDEAVGQLDRLSRLEGSRQWELEIRRERGLLAKMIDRDSEVPVDNEASNDTDGDLDETYLAETDSAETNENDFDGEIGDMDTDLRQAA
ncbi:MAG: CDC27 family protein [Pirellulales bacterium]|nr:CDC27 family protein [Pirellulales bacterium]